MAWDEGSKPTNPKDAIGSDKLPLHLWPKTATAVGCLGMLEGALKYGRNNFRAIGVRASIYYDAAGRHLDAWFEGEEKSPDVQLMHLANALACIAIIIDAQAAGKLNDDRNYEGGYRALVDQITPEVKRLKKLFADKDPKHYTISDNPQPAEEVADVGAHVGVGVPLPPSEQKPDPSLVGAGDDGTTTVATGTELGAVYATD